jgi:hypothetical protein
MKHQEYASDRKNDEEETGDPSQAERVGELKAMALDLCRKDVEEEVMIDEHGAFQIGIRYSCPEDRTPHHRI